MNKNNSYQNEKYVYWRDQEGRIHRYIKTQYKPRPGFYRLKFIQRPYFWWKFKSFDFKNAIIPIFISLAFGGIVFNMSMELSQQQVQRQIRAKMPEKFNEKNIKQFVRKRQEERKKAALEEDKNLVKQQMKV